jgi:uncharacterized protein (TIGR02246 family)
MSLEDKLAIQEVIARYAYTWDAKDADGVANLFTEDAVWEMIAPGDTWPSHRMESRAAIRTRHHQSGTVFDELSAATARTLTMVLVTHQGPVDLAPRSHRSGVYHDQWRKTPEGWKLVRRTLRHDGGGV